MRVKVEELPGSRKRIEVELEQEEVSKHFEDKVKRLARGAQIPGFRKGKVPGHILEKRMGKSLQVEVLEEIVDESYGKACREKDITPVSEPSVDTGNAMPQKDKPYSFSITVDTKPGVSIEDYKGLVLEREKVEVTDEHVSAAIQQEREERAEFLPVNDRPVMRDDWVLLDGKSFVDGNAVQDFSDYMVQVGSGRLPKEMDEGLVGCPVGQEKEISSTGKGGKQISYKLRVKGIKERRLLIVNDEFAKDVGGFPSLEELRADIRKRLESAAEVRVEHDLKRQIGEKLAGMVEVDVPQSFVERQVEHMRQIARAYVAGQETNQDDGELKKLATAQIKEHLAIEEIARRENITVTEEEVEKAGAEAAAVGLKKDAEDSDGLRWSLRRKKTVDFLLSHAKIEDKSKSLIMTPDEMSLIDRGQKGNS
jgi:trigger factor